MRTQVPKAPEVVTFESDYPGTADQAKHVRADLARIAGDCPALDELVLLASELATNAILHSRSGHPAGIFTVRAKLYPGHYAWVEVIDHGGTWTADRADDEQGRGMAIVATVAGAGNWGIGGGTSSPPRGSGSTGIPRSSSHEKVRVVISRNRLNRTKYAPM